MVVFNGYERSAFNFTIYCWVEISMSLSTKSDIAINAVKSLAGADISAPMPIQKIKIDYEDRNPLKD